MTRMMDTGREGEVLLSITTISVTIESGLIAPQSNVYTNSVSITDKAMLM